MDRGYAQRADVHPAAGHGGLDHPELAATPAGLADANRREHGHRPVLQPPHRERQHARGGWVKPLRVVYRKNQRPAGGHPVEQCRQRGADGTRVEFALARLGPQQRSLQRPPLRHGERFQLFVGYGAQQVGQRNVRQSGVR
jgi:hypothetical protein